MTSNTRPEPAACHCGHPKAAHEHYRAGTDCALCADCPRYRPRRGLLARLRALLGR